MNTKHNSVRVISILVVLITAGFLAGCENNGISPRFNAVAETAFSETIDVTTQTTFRLRGINGLVALTGSETASHITVSGSRWVTSDTEEDAQDRLQDLQVEMSSTGEAVLVETRQPQETEGRSYVVEYTVTVPADLTVDIIHVNGPVTVENVSGDVVVVDVNGNVTARDLGANSILRTTNGRILVDSALSQSATLKMSSVNGNVELTIPTDTSAWVSASLAIGGIRYSGLGFLDLEQSSHSLLGRLGSGDGTLILKTTNGNITMTGK